MYHTSTFTDPTQKIQYLHQQGCSLGLERLGLDSRDGLETFVGTSRLVSVLKVERLSLVSVSRVWKNRTSRSRLGLEGSTSRSRLGLKRYITSQSRSRDFSLVNIHSMHQACGYITKKIMDLTRKKQVVKWQTSPVGVLNCDTAVLIRFWNVLVSSRPWEFEQEALLSQRRQRVGRA